MTRYNHRCKMPATRELPDEVSSVVERWRCPICGMYWRVTHYNDGGLRASSILLPSLKRFLWQRGHRR